MDIQIRGRHVPVWGLLQDYSTTRIEVALDQFARRLQRVEVVFADLNGPRGGAAAACRVFVHLTDGRLLVVEARDTDFYAALRQAAEKASYRVGQALRPRRYQGSRTRGPSQPEKRTQVMEGDQR